MSSVFSAIGSRDTLVTDDEIRSRIFTFLEAMGPREDVLLLPPDYTRFHSQAGKITQFIAEYYNFIDSSVTTTTTTDSKSTRSRVNNEDESQRRRRSESTPDITILPALGTHAPMSDDQTKSMFGKELASKQPTPFVVHDWRKDVETIGYVPSEMVRNATRGRVDQPWPAQLNRLVWEKRHHDVQKQPHKSLVLSIGQVVPHEVMGMANFNKNLFVGVGGVEAINLSHFIGAVHGMENLMGRGSNPLRSILNHASEAFLQNELDLWYILTVMGTNDDDDDIVMKGLYIGNDVECYNQACDLSLQVNFTMLERPANKIVVHLDKDEFHSTWLGNKGIYRIRMAIADGGEVLLLAPGVSRFGEDDQVDRLIRKYGYTGTPSILDAMENNVELQENLSAVAHLIHGSSEGRFHITYCPGHLTKEEIESVGFKYGDLDAMTTKYDPRVLRDGFHTEQNDDGSTTEYYYISNPALGLWAVPSRFKEETETETDNSTATGSDNIVTVSSSAQTAAGNSGGVGGWVKPPSPGPK